MRSMCCHFYFGATIKMITWVFLSQICNSTMHRTQVLSSMCFDIWICLCIFSPIQHCPLPDSSRGKILCGKMLFCVVETLHVLGLFFFPHLSCQFSVLRVWGLSEPLLPVSYPVFHPTIWKKGAQFSVGQEPMGRGHSSCLLRLQGYSSSWVPSRMRLHIFQAPLSCFSGQG